MRRLSLLLIAAIFLLVAVSLVSAVLFYLWVYAISGTGNARPAIESFIAIVVVSVTTAYLMLANSRARS